jgi:hypothetical protein
MSFSATLRIENSTDSSVITHLSLWSAGVGGTSVEIHVRSDSDRWADVTPVYDEMINEGWMR